ncbi:MAG: molybdopterin molybdotransferase MoeA, partial [Arenicellales bacterium]|nr:molybdopterin molybdotransferase MoeA [Arenicellales bacterium]
MANNSEQKMLTFKEALTRIESSITPLSGSEQVSIVDALGRVAKQDVNSPIAVPAHTNSAMDGYAFRFDDITPSGESTHLIIIGGALAGKPFGGEVKSGECVRIMTGAVLPQGADTVVMQEQVEVTDSGALVGGEISKGQNVRQAGEDLQQGGVALAAGKRIRPAELGLLASIGVSDLTVTRRPKVAFFSTGDELRSIGERLEVGQIYDSNRYTLMGMLKDLGVE